MSGQSVQRYYDPVIGRLLSRDAVTAYGSGDMRQFNAYAYAFNNPYRFTDPDGRNPVLLLVAACAEVPACAYGMFAAGAFLTYEATNALEKLAPAIDRMFNESNDGETASKPPPGSKPIDKTEWSGDHGKIKGAIGAAPDDKVVISPDGQVWSQNPDGTWTNQGDAKDYTGSDKASGRKGKDRDRDREEQRRRDRERREREREQKKSGRGDL